MFKVSVHAVFMNIDRNDPNYEEIFVDLAGQNKYQFYACIVQKTNFCKGKKNYILSYQVETCVCTDNIETLTPLSALCRMGL